MIWYSCSLMQDTPPTSSSSFEGNAVLSSPGSVLDRRPKGVFVAKLVCLAVLVLCALVLGSFVLMADSGGKQSRPDIFAALVLAIVCVSMVKRNAASQSKVSAWLAAAALLAPAPLALEIVLRGRGSWETHFAICWWLCSAASGIAARVSQRMPEA